MRELEEYRAELAQEEAEARRLDSFRTSLEEVQAHLDWAVGNMAAIQTRIAATKQRLERCAPEDRTKCQQALEDANQRLEWAGAVFIEAQERVAICAEELAEEAQERLDQAFTHLEWAEALHAEAKARVEELKESLMLAEANVVGTRDLVREAQDNIGFWADELSEALAKAQARTRG